MDESKRKGAKDGKAVGHRRSGSERRQLVSEYRASGQTQETFAARKGLNVGTLRGWIYRRPRDAAERGALAPVRIEGDPRPAGRPTRGAITVRWPQGMEVEVAVELDGAGALRLVRELLAPCLR